MKKILKKPHLLTLIGALLLFAGWPTSPLFPLLFVGMAAFLLAAKSMIDDEVKAGKYFWVIFSGLLLWNVLTTWWIYHATVGGVLMAVIGNSLLMYLPFMLFRLAHKVKVYKITMLVFIVSWLGYEWLHHNWSLTWPWITLGNGLAKFPSLVQWYEYTGTAGGSLWILLINAMIYNLIVTDKTVSYKRFIPLVISVLVPMILSQRIESSYHSKMAMLDVMGTEVVVLQPNFNTYTQKNRRGDDFIPYNEQLTLMIKASKEQLTQRTEFLVWPETAITGSHIERTFNRSGAFSVLKNFLSEYPNLTLVAGLDSYDICADQENPPENASYSARGDFYYTPYNTSLMMRSDTIAYYHKNKFVPGAEQIPFKILIEPIETLLGGVGFGQFVGQENQVPFTSKSGIKASPAICYESIFGEHMAEFSQNGADIHFIITNDDWWHDTEGHRQHYEYARLRAIETRTPIARSGNTGFSGFFNVIGGDSQKTKYRENACIKEDLILSGYETFYIKYGDYIGKTAAYLAVLLIISLLVKRFTPKK